jgi:hypothetical protein
LITLANNVASETATAGTTIIATTVITIDTIKSESSRFSDS